LQEKEVRLCPGQLENEVYPRMVGKECASWEIRQVMIPDFKNCCPSMKGSSSFFI
jgi:hypothetical protein